MECSEFSEFGVWGFGHRVECFEYRIPVLESKTNNSIMIKLYYESFIVRGVWGLRVKIQDFSI